MVKYEDWGGRGLNMETEDCGPLRGPVPVGGEAEARPRPKKRHQKRLQRPSGDARLANKRGKSESGGTGTPGRRAVEPWDGMLSEDLCT